MQSLPFTPTLAGMPSSLLQPLSALPSSHFSSAPAPATAPSWPRFNSLGLEKQQHQQSWDMSSHHHQPTYASHPRSAAGSDDQAVAGAYRPAMAMSGGSATGAGPSAASSSHYGGNPSFGYGSGPAYSTSAPSTSSLQPSSMAAGTHSSYSGEDYYSAYPQAGYPVHGAGGAGSMSVGPTMGYPSMGPDPTPPHLPSTPGGWEQGYSSSAPMPQASYGMRPMYQGFGMHGGQSQLLGPFEVKHRRRTTKGQFRVLEGTFQATPKPTAAVRKQLSEQLDMPPRAVQIWFQNRRAKAKAMLKKEASKKAEAGGSNTGGASSSSSFSANKLSTPTTATSRYSSGGGLASPSAAYHSATSPSSSSLGNDSHRPSSGYGSQGASGLTGFAYQPTSSSSSASSASWAPRSLTGMGLSSSSTAKPLGSSGPPSSAAGGFPSGVGEESSRFRVPMLPVRDMLGGSDMGGPSSQQQQQQQQPPRGGILLSGLGGSTVSQQQQQAMANSTSSAWSAPASTTTFPHHHQHSTSSSSSSSPMSDLPFLRSNTSYGAPTSWSSSSPASYDESSRLFNRRPGTAGATMTSTTSSGTWGSSESVSPQGPYLQPLTSSSTGHFAGGQSSSSASGSTSNVGEGGYVTGGTGSPAYQERPANWRY